jgi:hypothetical protein
MARRNLCINPTLSVANTGWGGASTPARQTGLSGFVRTFGARYSSGTFATSPASPITVGLVYTVSVYVRSNVFNWNSGNVYAEFLNSGGGTVSAPSQAFSSASGVVTRVSVANVTAPVGAVTLRIVVDGNNFGSSNSDLVAALIEQVAAVGTYFDGDSPLGSWDGTVGLSSSTLADPATLAPRMTSQYGSYF